MIHRNIFTAIVDARDALHDAKAFARHAHGKQRYGSYMYMHHVEEVVNILFETHGSNLSVSAYMAAYLHDTVEDTDTFLSDIHIVFGKKVCGIVNALTQRKNEDYFTRYLIRCMKNEDARKIKHADIQANLQACFYEGGTPKKNKRALASKYILALRIILRIKE